MKKKKIHITILLSLILLISYNAQAQTIFHIQAPIQPNCKVAWEYYKLDPNDSSTIVTSWVLSLNGSQADIGNVSPTGIIAANGNNNFEIPCPGFAIGNTILVIYAKNSVGLSPPSTEIQIIVDPPIPVKLAPRPAFNVKVGGQ